jgi:fermentation-respiration switch protein FrsA (DUF1100 family)
MMRTLIVLVVLALLLLALAWTMQRRMIYFPTAGPVAAPPAGSGGESVSLTTDDGVTLGAWFFPATQPNAPTVVVFNGNAGNRSHRLPFALELRRLGAAVLLFDYRGFGGNGGSPSEGGLAADARAARAYVTVRTHVDSSRIVYFGESLGAAVAATLASTDPPAALILRSPFASLAEVGRHHYPFLPVRWLLRDRFAVADAVSRVRVPTLIVVGADDSIVPPEQSRRVFAAAAGPKELVVVPGADHNDQELFTGSLMMRAIERALASSRFTG